ncbi:MAG: hypothetical protein NC311_08980 [Muribaculaceae bacterium]|nr:hypothetical protein [Muribaculaceae bacterium]
MAYADHAFYRDTFRGQLTAEEFDRWAAKASLQIDQATQDRAASAPPEMERALALCCCALAEQLKAWDDQDAQTKGGILAGEEVDGYRVSYRGSNAVEQVDPAVKRRRELRSICADYLCRPVNLMYRGVC